MLSGLVGSQDPLLWYVNRSTGLVLLVLLTLTTALGVVASRRAPSGVVPRFVPQAVHRGLALLSLLLLAGHVASAVVDEYVDIRWWHAFVPAHLQYRPTWLALGVLASDVLLLVVATSLVRTRLRHRHWRAVHLTTYAAWGVAVLHGLGIGTDTRTPVVVWTYAGCATLVAVAGVHRLVTSARLRSASHEARHGSPTSRTAAPSLARVQR